MIGVIDRFEEDFAVIVLDDGRVLNLERTKLPEEAKEGDVIVLGDEIRIDFSETQKRKENSNKYLELWED